MHIEIVDRADDVTQLALVGRLDVGGVGEVDLKLHALTAAAGRPTVLDLSRLEYIASLGMGLLVSCAHALSVRRCAFVVAGATPVVDAALRSAGLDQAFPMVADVDEANRVLAAA